MPKVYSYTRFSRPEQAKGDSLRRQTEDAEKYAAARGLVLDGSLRMHDAGKSAYSGANIDEGALGEFLAAVERGQIEPGSILVVERIDRLSRLNPWWAMDVFGRIIRSGITIATVNPEREYRATDTNPMAIMEMVFQSALAHEESKKKAERQSAVWTQKRKLAAEKKLPMTAACPQWLRLEDGRYVQIPERVAVVRRIFGLAQKGYSTDRIVRTLTEEKIAAWGRSRRWNSAYLYTILSNRRVLGEYRPTLKTQPKVKLPPIPNYYPAVVSEEVFYAVQRGLELRRDNPGRKPAADYVNILSGLVWGYGDGLKMHYATNGVNGYIATSAYEYGGARNGQSFRYVPLERCVLACLSGLRLEITPPESETKIAAVEGRLSELRSGRQKVKEKLSKYPNSDSLIEALGNFDAEIGQLTAELEQTKKAAATSTGGEVESLIRQMDRSRGDKRNEIGVRLQSRLREVIESVWVFVEVINRLRKVAHVQVYLRDGRRVCRRTQWPPPKPEEAASTTDYSVVDFRAKWKHSGCK